MVPVINLSTPLVALQRGHVLIVEIAKPIFDLSPCPREGLADHCVWVLPNLNRELVWQNGEEAAQNMNVRQVHARLYPNKIPLSDMLAQLLIALALGKAVEIFDCSNFCGC